MTDFAKKIDKEENDRINELYKQVQSGKDKFTAAEVFGSEAVSRMLGEKPLSYYDTFTEIGSKLPLTTLLHSHVLINICPWCSCSHDPSLIEPHLERGLVLPVLNTKLAKYRQDFIDLVIQFPYITKDAFAFLTNMHPYTRTVICDHCYKEEWKTVFTEITKRDLPEKQKKRVTRFLRKMIKPAMSSPSEGELNTLHQMQLAATQGHMTYLLSLARKGRLISSFKLPRVFGAIPQVDQNDLNNIGMVSKEYGFGLDHAINEMQEKELTIKGLNLDYDPKKPVESYLDVILPRRKKINDLVKELISSDSREKQVSRINDELWKINREVVTSKSLESLSFVTSLITDNLSIITILLAGALIGYSSAQVLGCGIGTAGGIIGSIAGKKLSPQMGLKVPQIPRTSIEWLKTQLENPEEKMLSLILSKDVKAIQVWQLRRKLGRQ